MNVNANKNTAEWNCKAESEKLRALIESTDDLVWVVEPFNYGLTTFNTALYNYFKTGRGVELKVGMTPENMLPDKYVKQWKLLYKKVLKDGAYKIDYITSSNSMILNLSFNPVKIDNEIIGISVFGTDMTNHKNIENNLHESLSQNKRIMDNLQDAYFQADLAGNFTKINPKALTMYGYNSIDEMIGIPAINLYASPLERGILIEELKDRGSINDYRCMGCRKDGTTFWVSMNIQFIKDDTGEIIGTEGLVRDITERKELEDKLNKKKEDLIFINEKLKQRLDQSVNAISKIGELRDSYTAGHQKRVMELASEIGQSMGLSEKTILNITYGALLHDIGKIHISSDILNKPGTVSKLEYQLMQTHVEHSYDIVKEIDFPAEIHTMIHQHHERLDGTGYPLGLSGAEIILESRILAVADVVEAMISHRPYRPALGIDIALEEIENNKGIKFDEEVVDCCIKIFREKNFQFNEN
ncbi:MAG: PAS domain S-box protein [Firmicutes bacterium]|nr:PAS domain S-box protein [Bacillota bacterium]